MLTESQFFITLSRLKTSLVDATLAAPWGCQTTLFTGSCLVDILPETHTMFRTFMNGNAIEGLERPDHYWLSSATQELAIVPCGAACPSLRTNNSSARKYNFIRLQPHANNDELYLELLRCCRQVNLYTPICLNHLCVNNSNDHYYTPIIATELIGAYNT